MANEISLVRYAGSLVTPQHDAITADYSTRNNGIYYGCTVTIKNANTLHITAGQGVIYGRQFEIVDSDIPASLSSSGTLLGQLYVHIDLDNTTEPISLEVETGNSLTPLTDDPLINVSAAVSEMQLATFTVSTSTIASLVTTYDTVDKIGDVLGDTDISAIGDGSVTGAISTINTNLSKNSCGNEVVISSAYTASNPYVFPNDGYVTVSSQSSTSGYIRVPILGSNNNIGAYLYMNVTGTTQIQSLFVKKGMKAYIYQNTTDSSRLSFIPIL